MGLFDYLRTQFLDIIEWRDDSRDTLVHKFDDEDMEIKNGAALIVRESQTAQFMYCGQFGDTFGPGKHDLVTDNIPILSTLKGWKYGFESPFKADVWYVSTRTFTGNKWGTATPFLLRDPDFKAVRCTAYGTYDFKIVDVPTFLSEVSGTDSHFTLDEFVDTVRPKMVSIIADCLASSGVPVLDMATRFIEVGEAVLPAINNGLRAKFGIEMTDFVLQNVGVPKIVQDAIDKRGAMSTIGNMQDYVMYNMAEGMGKGNSGGGTGGMASEMAIGFGMAQQFMRQSNMVNNVPGIPPVGPPAYQAAAPPAPAAAPAAAPASAGGIPKLMSVAECAALVGVSEQDILDTLTAGDLKGKKFGSTWRIPKKSLDEFLGA